MERVSMATAGVGIGPSRSTSMPDRGEAGDQGGLDHVAREPRVLADHHPVAVIARAETTRPAAWPTFRASSGVISPLARPRMPSVPKYLRACFVSAFRRAVRASVLKATS